MAYPEWSLVPFDQTTAFYDHVMCMPKEATRLRYVAHNMSNDLNFNKHCVLVKNVCHVFVWVESFKAQYRSGKSTCKSGKFDVQFIYFTVKSTFPPVLNCEKTKLILFDAHFKQITTTMIKPGRLYQGLLDTEQGPIKGTTGGHLFACESRIYISFTSFCDAMKDCPEEPPKDENHCKCSDHEALTPVCQYTTQSSK